MARAASTSRRAADLEQALADAGAERRRRRDGGGGGGLPAAARRCRARCRGATPAAAVSLALEPVPDLLAGLARGAARDAAVPGRLRRRDRRPATRWRRAPGAKLREKGCDAIVANDVSAAGDRVRRGRQRGDAAVRGRRAASCSPRAGKRGSPTACGACWRRGCPAARRHRVPDPRLKTYAPQAVRHLAAAGAVAGAAAGDGGRPPRQRPAVAWLGRRRLSRHAVGDLDLGAAPAAVGRAAGSPAPRDAGWAFVDANAKRFIPDAIDNEAGDEAAYDCALALLAIAAERALGPIDARRQAIGDRAARVLANYLGALEDLSGREFRDPGLPGVRAGRLRARHRRSRPAGGRAQVRRPGLRHEDAGAVRRRAGGVGRPVRFLVDDRDARPGGHRRRRGDTVRGRVAARARRRPACRRGSRRAAWTRTPGTRASRGRWARRTSCRPIRCSCRRTATSWTSWSGATAIATARSDATGS